MTPSEFVATVRKLVAGDGGHYRKLELIEQHLGDVVEGAPEEPLPADADPLAEGADADVPAKKGRAKKP